MFIIYIVQNDGIGVVGTATHDLTCNPSECFWLVPGTHDEQHLKIIAAGNTSPPTLQPRTPTRIAAGTHTPARSQGWRRS